MLKKIRVLLPVILMTFIVSCNSADKKPFGAKEYDYDKVQVINKEGPVVESVHSEKVAPFSEKTIIEVGPSINNNHEVKIEPTADKDLNPDFGGIPITPKENNN